MRTPRFECSQDEESVHLRIHAPYVRTQDFEFSIDGSEFRFYVKPFLLHLDFRHDLAEDGRESLRYDYETGYVDVDLPKMEKGTHFENLEMLSLLLSPAKGRDKQPVVRPHIEVVDSHDFDDHDPGSGDADVEVGSEEEAKGETVDEECVGILMGQLLISKVMYGFNDGYSGVFSGREDDLSDLLELQNPETVKPKIRRELRVEKESNKFDPEHYAADFALRDYLREPLKFKLKSKHFANLDGEQKDALIRLPRREYLATSGRQTHQLLCNLANIMFAYLYEYRATLGEMNVESGWTIARISPTLSWLEAFDSATDSVLAAFRRSLAYPLYRNFELSTAVLQDLKSIFRNGRHAVLHCLLNVKRVFERDDLRRLFNDIYILDYCAWIQGLRDEQFLSFVRELTTVEIEKADIDWDLDEIEEMVLEADVAS